MPSAALGFRTTSDENSSLQWGRCLADFSQQLPTSLPPTYTYPTRDPGHKRARGRRRPRYIGWPQVHFSTGITDPSRHFHPGKADQWSSSKHLAFMLRVTENFFESQSSWGSSSCTVSAVGSHTTCQAMTQDGMAQGYSRNGWASTTSSDEQLNLMCEECCNTWAGCRTSVLLTSYITSLQENVSAEPSDLLSYGMAEVNVLSVHGTYTSAPEDAPPCGQASATLQMHQPIYKRTMFHLWSVKVKLIGARLISPSLTCNICTPKDNKTYIRLQCRQGLQTPNGSGPYLFFFLTFCPCGPFFVINCCYSSQTLDPDFMITLDLQSLETSMIVVQNFRLTNQLLFKSFFFLHTSFVVFLLISSE